MTLRVAFGGTPEVAVPTLEALCHADGIEVVAVFTRPDRPRGRGRAVQQSPVKEFALDRDLPVLQPDRAGELTTPLSELRCDAGVVVAFGALLPPALLEVPRLGFVNLHFSLLPRWRGAAPVQHAIREGDAQTGLTVFRLTEGLDDGPIVRQERVQIGADDDAGTVLNKLSARGPGLVIDALKALDAGEQPQPQPETGVTFAPKLTPDDLEIPWELPAKGVADMVRSVAPLPGARTSFRDAALKVLRVTTVDGDVPVDAPGTVVDVSRDAVVVACGVGTVRLLEVQPAGRARMAIGAFVNGYAPKAGERFAGTR